MNIYGCIYLIQKCVGLLYIHNSRKQKNRSCKRLRLGYNEFVTNSLIFSSDFSLNLLFVANPTEKVIFIDKIFHLLFRIPGNPTAAFPIAFVSNINIFTIVACFIFFKSITESIHETRLHVEIKWMFWTKDLVFLMTQKSASFNCVADL